jgi:acetyltransferase-like isoleucine patch superfamily enzyme
MKILKNQFSMMKFDLSHRTIGIFIQYILILIPDLFSFVIIRLILLKLAGVQIKNFSNTVIRRGIFIEYPKNLIINEGVQININCYFGSNSKIEIGRYSRIAANVKILTTFHKGENFLGEDIFEPVSIGSGVHVGASAIIMPGTVVGDNVLISPGSVVSGYLSSGSIYVGNPARNIGKRDDLI